MEAETQDSTGRGHAVAKVSVYCTHHLDVSFVLCQGATATAAHLVERASARDLRQPARGCISAGPRGQHRSSRSARDRFVDKE